MRILTKTGILTYTCVFERLNTTRSEKCIQSQYEQVLGGETVLMQAFTRINSAPWMFINSLNDSFFKTCLKRV